jgi:hypothetical protein
VLEYDEDDYESMSAVDPNELHALAATLETLPGYRTDGIQDWAVEREEEIYRLDKENEELRKMLGIDSASIAASGIDMEAEIARMEMPRNPELYDRRRGHNQQPSDDRWELKPSYWEGAPPNPGAANGQQPFQQAQPSPQLPQQQNNAGGTPLQRAMDLSNGMRMMQGGRRTGIFGGGQQRGGAPVGAAAGRGMPMAPPSSGLSLWSNQPPSPSPVLADRYAPERPWQAGGSSNLDLNR